MEKKSLGRGLEEISNVFLSQTADAKRRGDPSVAKPREGLCLSCRNYVEGPFEPPQCKIFAGSNGETRAPRPDPLAMSHAGYCHHFEASLPSRPPASTDQNEEDRSLDHLQCEIEETVSVHRKISYPGRRGGQQKIKKALEEHLDAGFSIKSIELSRAEEGDGPQRSVRHEEVILFLKESPA